MKRDPGFFILLILLMFALAACEQAAPSTALDPQAQSDNLLWKDDFSDPTSGWDSAVGADGETNYQNGAYKIQVNLPNRDLWANPGLTYVDVIVETDATKVGGPDDNDFGIICRYQDVDNFYFLLISSQGYFGIGKFKEGLSEMIGTPPNPRSDKINQGAAMNRLRAECIGNRLTLFANGEKLIEVQDSEFASGDIGLMAGAFDTPGTLIVFDNFVVTKP
jgi:hypothetical protein